MKSQAIVFISIFSLMMYMFFGLVRQLQSPPFKTGLIQTSEVLAQPFKR